jgi:hypothetical protein
MLYTSEVNYYNIYSYVKILITNEEAIKNNENIPEFIETIIIKKCIYKNNKKEIEKIKNTINLVELIIEMNEIESLKLIEKSEINVNQIFLGMSPLIWCCYNKFENLVLKLLENPELNLKYKTISGCSALDYAEHSNLQTVINKINEINKN